MIYTMYVSVFIFLDIQNSKYIFLTKIIYLDKKNEWGRAQYIFLTHIYFL